MSDRGTSLLILLPTLLKSSAWSSAAFSVASESALITNVPTNRSSLDDQSHSLLVLREAVVFIAEEDHCRDINLESKRAHVWWDKKGRVYSSSHSHTNVEALSPAHNRPFLTALMHNIEWSKMAEARGSAPAQQRKCMISESVRKHLLYRNTAGERYGLVAEGLFLQFFPICTGNLNEDFKN